MRFVTEERFSRFDAMFETQMHFVLLIGNPIKCLKSRNTKTDTVMTIHISTTQSLVLICPQFHLLINRCPTHFLSSSLCFCLTHSATNSVKLHSTAQSFTLRSIRYFCLLIFKWFIPVVCDYNIKYQNISGG